MKQFTFIFPGQGAQYAGMGKAWYEGYQGAKELFQEADDSLGYALSKLIFSGPESELTQTKISQPAIFITSMAILKALRAEFGLESPISTCGLSLGEYCALVAAGMVDFSTALKLVAERGKFMHQACEEKIGSMKVVLGLADEIVEKAVAEINLPNDLYCANFNCPGQVVISGTLPALEAAEPVLKNLGAKRIMPLSVHGAFHSGLMLSAQERLAPLIQQSQIHESTISLAMNVSGNIEKEVDKIKTLLIQQVSSPVRWHKCITSCIAHGTDCFIEIGPGKTLAGMLKRSQLTQPILSIDSPEDFASIESILNNL